MKHNNIYLVGFMGSGKTSVLKKIRQKIQSNTFDLDENIEKEHGNISKIFESKGEKYFRQIELETFQMLPKNDSVVALGGGSLEIKNIFDELKNNGFTFEEVNIEHDPEARNLLVQNGFRSVPQIFYNKKLLVEGGADGLKKETKETLQEKIDACSK